MSEPSEDLATFYGHMARLLNTGDGQMLLEWLEARYVERREIVTEQTPAGTLQRVARTSIYSDTPYDTYRRVGHMEIINLLKDLQEWRTS
jgi:hypothetical protein